MTPVVLNRVLRQVFRQGLAVTLGLWIPFVALSIGSVAGFAQERSAAAAPGAGSIIGQVKAITGQVQTNVLSGIEVALSGAPLGSSHSTVSDEEGHFQFVQLPAGTYRLEASPEGFRPWATTVTLGQGEAALQDIVLQINSAVQGLEVRGDASEISAESAETNATLNDEQLNTLPLAQQKFTDALSLTPEWFERMKAS